MEKTKQKENGINKIVEYIFEMIDFEVTSYIICKVILK